MKVLPRVILSACLCGISCRYNGTAQTLLPLEPLLRTGLGLPMCPEVLGGLPIPRPPCERIGGRVCTADGDDCTEAFIAGANSVLKVARHFGIGYAILKERSPSCGVHEIYDGSFSRRRIAGAGVCTELLLRNDIVVYSEADSRLEQLLRLVSQSQE